MGVLITKTLDENRHIPYSTPSQLLELFFNVHVLMFGIYLFRVQNVPENFNIYILGYYTKTCLFTHYFSHVRFTFIKGINRTSFLYDKGRGCTFNNWESTFIYGVLWYIRWGLYFNLYINTQKNTLNKECFAVQLFRMIISLHNQ